MYKIDNLEITNPGNANGISLQLQKIIEDEGEERSLTTEEKQIIIDNASIAYGNFLDALGVDWKNDPNSADTPKRIAKKYVLEQWAGRYNIPPEISTFQSDGFRGMVV